MQYGIMFFSDDKLKRTDAPDMSMLPDKCCAKCEQWCDISGVLTSAICAEHSTCDWDALTWADDCCESFAPN